MVQRLAPSEAACLAGGLALEPSNLHHLARLEAIAMMSVAGVATGKQKVTRTLARKLFDGPLHDWVGFDDDPLEGLATRAFTYNGGTHVLLAPEANALNALRHLAVAVRTAKGMSPALVRRITGLIQGTCHISDLVARRAGLERNLSAHAAGFDARIPASSRLRKLMAAVSLPRDEVLGIQQRSFLHDDDLDALCSTPGAVSLPRPPWDSTELCQRPFLRLGAKTVVVAPHRLTEAVVRRVLWLVDQHDVSATVADEVHLGFFIAADSALRRLGMTASMPPRAPSLPLSDSLAAHALYQFDDDKLLHLALYGDALEPGTAWQTEELSAELAKTRDNIQRLLDGGDARVESWTTLVLLAPLGRDGVTEFPVPGADDPGLLVFSASDLDDIVVAEGSDRSPLLLWKYERALRHIEKQGSFIAQAPLDIYAIWHGRERTFPASVGGPIAPLIQPGSGAAIRERAARNADWHALPAPDPRMSREVVIAEGPELPVYVSPSFSAESPDVAVELAGGPIVWIVASGRLDEDVWPRWGETARMMAYWIVEFGRALSDQFGAVRTAGREVLLIELEYALEADTALEDLGYAIQIEQDRVAVRVTTRLVERYDDTNSVERALARRLVAEVLRSGGIEDAHELVEAKMDSVAPVGVKRMLHTIHTGVSPEFICGHLPRGRYPHPADLWLLRRELLQQVPLGSDRVVGKSAGDWLNRVVAKCFEGLRRAISPVDGRVLLQRLVLDNEALVQEDATRDSTMASQLACWAGDSSHVERLVQQIPRHALASMATRFLVELVAAETPSGDSSPSGQLLDGLLARAATIIQLGIASDVQRFELAEVAVRVVDGDFTIDSGTFDEAARGTVMAINRAHVDSERSRTRVRGSQRLRRRDSSASSDEVIANLDAGLEVELGVSLTDIGLFIGEAIRCAQDEERGLVMVDRHDLISGASSRLSWPLEKAELALSALLLSPRPDYLKAPAGFEATDIWPWKFNRGLSYIRRPFIAFETDAGVQIWFTPGHVFRGGRNLVGLLTTARYKAKTRELARAMGPIKEEAAAILNEEVADVLRSRGMQTETQVKRVGRLRVASSTGDDLGDVDVLAIDMASSTIFAIECKDFEMARVPHEVRADLRELFVADGGRRCVQDKHERRVAWVAAHVPDILRWALGQEHEASEWEVKGAFVFSTPLISPLLGHARMPVWTISELRAGSGP